MSTKNHNEYILCIDTASSREAIVALKVDGDSHRQTREYGIQRSQVLFPLIDSMLTERNVSLRALSGIEVNIGPGSYTGLKVGVAVANALGFFLNIPINHQRPGELVDPTYT